MSADFLALPPIHMRSNKIINPMANEKSKKRPPYLKERRMLSITENHKVQKMTNETTNNQKRIEKEQQQTIKNQYPPDENLTKDRQNKHSFELQLADTTTKTKINIEHKEGVNWQLSSWKHTTRKTIRYLLNVVYLVVWFVRPSGFWLLHITD